jgi:hypothetical protein
LYYTGGVREQYKALFLTGGSVRRVPVSLPVTSGEGKEYAILGLHQ